MMRRNRASPRDLKHHDRGAAVPTDQRERKASGSEGQTR